MSNPFYNPYMKGPDFGSGIGDTAQNAMMAMLIRKYLGQMGQGPQTETVMPNQLPRNSPAQGPAGQAVGMPPVPMQETPFSGGQMNPQMMAQLQALMQYLKQSGMGR